MQCHCEKRLRSIIGYNQDVNQTHRLHCLISWTSKELLKEAKGEIMASSDERLKACDLKMKGNWAWTMGSRSEERLWDGIQV